MTAALHPPYSPSDGPPGPGLSPTSCSSGSFSDTAYRRVPTPPAFQSSTASGVQGSDVK